MLTQNLFDVDHHNAHGVSSSFRLPKSVMFDDEGKGVYVDLEPALVENLVAWLIISEGLEDTIMKSVSDVRFMHPYEAKEVAS